ncbi:SDR family NAD(P)-dependent oxidoreductase [Parapedobacter sp. 10938]|uniref:SDR family NAD(P)-dependent oxidoreductase n=1 Tax=Parapedobacter flavus TaxID=3110225 RepID=UPI002DB9ED9D|nr:SDR family oxidoreductase [Parapedobacter sp. 10938]MEC3878529.1 SDR family oxidoreductase [Parapedobacter sp. 10938]
MSRKKIVVLGGSSGIGKAIAERFAKEGWLVIIASSDQNKLDAAYADLVGDDHEAIQLDIRNESHLQNFVSHLRDQHTDFDVLVNSIGVSEHLGALDSDFGNWDNALQVMLYGTVKSCRALVPYMKQGGRIIHITSIHYERVEKGSSAYGMAKAAITQFTRSLALELAPRNILVNTIAPGFIDTPMSIDCDGQSELETEWFRDNYIKYDHLPLKRAGKPDEIAGVAYFLAGPDATYITGSVITVDGGLTITF